LLLFAEISQRIDPPDEYVKETRRKESVGSKGDVRLGGTGSPLHAAGTCGETQMLTYGDRTRDYFVLRATKKDSQ